MKTHDQTLDDLRHFIQVWWSAASLDDVLPLTGMDRRGASNLAAYLRRHGVALKRMPCGGGRVGVERLGDADYAALRLIGEHERTAAEVRRRYR